MIIKTNRLILRPFCGDDAADIFEYLASPPVNCFADMKLNSLENARSEANRRSSYSEYYLAVVLKDSGKVIGEIWAFPDERNSDTFSPCWIFNGDYQGKGYALEAAQAFFNYLFAEKGARRIYAYIISHLSACVKNLACAKRDFLKNLYRLSAIRTEHQNTKTHCSMQF